MINLENKYEIEEKKIKDTFDLEQYYHVQGKTPPLHNRNTVMPLYKKINKLKKLKTMQSNTKQLEQLKS